MVHSVPDQSSGLEEEGAGDGLFVSKPFGSQVT